LHSSRQRNKAMCNTAPSMKKQRTCMDFPAKMLIACIIE
jgi:hypothetical protein